MRLPVLPVAEIDRQALRHGLVAAGHSPANAANVAAELPDDDGALQMLARHRIVAEEAERTRVALILDRERTALERAPGVRVPWSVTWSRLDVVHKLIALIRGAA